MRHMNGLGFLFNDASHLLENPSIIQLPFVAPVVILTDLILFEKSCCPGFDEWAIKTSMPRSFEWPNSSVNEIGGSLE